jgi:hypothetical protein
MTGQIRLEVLVSVSCAGCARALALAQRFALDRPDVLVDVVDVDEPGWRPHPGFAGTPMFYLGDTVVSYGNPELAQLHAAVEAWAA